MKKETKKANNAEKVFGVTGLATPSTSNIASRILDAMLLAEKLGVHYRVYTDNLGKKMFSLRFFDEEFKRDRNEDIAFDDAGGLSYLEGELAMVAARQEKERLRGILRAQALAKLTPEEQDAVLGKK